MKFRYMLLLSFCVTVAIFIVGALSGVTRVGSSVAGPRVLSAQTGVEEVYTPAARTKTSGCVAHGALPDPECTPGAVFGGLSLPTLCAPGYSKSVRSVSASLKEQVFVEYGITSHASGEYEVDHLISLELGGSNDIANLWPEPAEPTLGFHQKDIVENFLHSQVCDKAVSLGEAQKVIATDWLDIFHQMRD